MRRAASDAPAFQVRRDHDQIVERPGQPVEFPDHQHVTGSAALCRFRQSLATVQDSESVALVDDLTPCPAQRVELQGKVLIVGRDAGISDHHGKIPLPEFCPTLLPCSSPFDFNGLESCGRRDRRLPFCPV